MDIRAELHSLIDQIMDSDNEQQDIRLRNQLRLLLEYQSAVTNRPASAHPPWEPMESSRMGTVSNAFPPPYPPGLDEVVEIFGRLLSSIEERRQPHVYVPVGNLQGGPDTNLGRSAGENSRQAGDQPGSGENPIMG